MQAKQFTIQYYNTNVGIFFKLITGQSYVSNLAALGITSIAGVDIKNMYSNNGWTCTHAELKDFIKIVPGTNEITSYRLRNEALASESIPLTIQASAITKEWSEDSDSWKWTGAYATLEALYQPVYTKLEPTLEKVDHLFELVKIRDLEVENWQQPENLTVVSLEKSGYIAADKVLDLSKIVNISDIEAILTPEFLLHNCKCFLTSEQVYKIVRSHVIRNIDNQYARITSNYDFCFTVKKKVKAKAFVVQKEKLTPRGNSYKPPKYYNETKDTKEVECFEMTWHGADKRKGYGSYTVIEAWRADNLQDLYNNIQAYLEDLMHIINTPWAYCECCDGTGFQKPIFELNKRV